MIRLSDCLARAALLTMCIVNANPALSGAPDQAANDPIIIAPAPEPVARTRRQLGYGRLITNDSLGEYKDRWQTGSVASSRVRGFSWSGTMPDAPGEILEFRVNAGLMAPASLRYPSVIDRPMAAAISLGLHTHWQRRGWEMALGGDLVVTGPQTGLIDFQTALHDLIGIRPAKPSIADDQIADGVHPTLVAELGRDFALGKARLRPFVEARWGAETLARAGIDVTFGQIGLGELLVREPVTGQRYRVISNRAPGMSLVAGADIAAVDSSIFLPRDRGLELTDARRRIRAGLHWQGEKYAAFYGLTWLGEEFTSQPEGQLVGSVRLQLSF